MDCHVIWSQNGLFNIPKNNGKKNFPMAKHMLIYIDNLLVFSEDEASHINHLQQFHDLLL